MMARHLLTVTSKTRALAIAGIDAAIQRARQGDKPWTLELREAKRSDEQNRALWGLLRQITKQRPTHNNVQMSDELWKCVFMQALGVEMTMLPTLEGNGYFPVGHRSSRLTKSEFTALLELMLCWCAQQGIMVEHFGPDVAPPHAEAA